MPGPHCPIRSTAGPKIVYVTALKAMSYSHMHLLNLITARSLSSFLLGRYRFCTATLGIESLFLLGLLPILHHNIRIQCVEYIRRPFSLRLLWVRLRNGALIALNRFSFASISTTSSSKWKSSIPGDICICSFFFSINSWIPCIISGGHLGQGFAAL